MMPVETLEFEEICFNSTDRVEIEPYDFANIASDAYEQSAESMRRRQLGSDYQLDLANSPGCPVQFEDLSTGQATFAGLDELERTTSSARAEEAGDEEPASRQTARTASQKIDSGQDIERARQEAWDEGLARGREESIAAVRSEREQFVSRIDALFCALEEDRELYLRRLADETVRLSLLCASRILRREVAIDPLALTGAVRVALGQLKASTDVRLVVPATEESLWCESIALIPGLACRPSVVAEDVLKAGECRVESDLGIADLSIGSQLTVLEESLLQTKSGSLERGYSKIEIEAGPNHEHVASKFESATSGSRFQEGSSGIEVGK